MRRRFATWTLLYALAVIYVSIAIGPDGFHLIPRDPGEAWRALLNTPYVLNGSDQRADWMANLTMTVPLGFLGMGTFWTKTPGAKRWMLTGLLLICCLGFVIGVKYLQLFSESRTVTLNYILAQSLGSVLGIGLFWTLSPKVFASTWTIQSDGQRILRTALRVYVAGFILYVLFPFDFVLSGADFIDRIAALPKWLFSWPGAGRSNGVRIILIVAQIAETVPIGILFATRKDRASIRHVAVSALVTMSFLSFASILVISATPNLISIVFRAIGIVVGAVATIHFRPVYTKQLRVLLERSALIAVVPYALSVLYINGLLTLQWRTIDEARTALDLRSLLPLWNYYMVSKAHAMASLVVHALTFAPVGVLISLRGDHRKGTAGRAAVIAFFFSVAIEFGRWFKPGLQPDFNNTIIAAISAWLAVKTLPILWQVAGEPTSVVPVSSATEYNAVRGAE